MLPDSLYYNIHFIGGPKPNPQLSPRYTCTYEWNMLILYLPFWGTVKLFSTVAAAFYISINNVLRFQFLHILIGI